MVETQRAALLVLPVSLCSLCLQQERIQARSLQHVLRRIQAGWRGRQHSMRSPLAKDSWTRVCSCCTSVAAKVGAPIRPACKPVLAPEHLRTPPLMRAVLTAQQASTQHACPLGDWLLLKNLHLAISWLPVLEKAVHAMAGRHPNFRLFLTTQPHPKFPRTLLEGCTKACLWSPCRLPIGCATPAVAHAAAASL